MKTLELALGMTEDSVELCEVEESALTLTPEMRPEFGKGDLSTDGQRYLYWQSMLEAKKAEQKAIRAAMDGEISFIESRLEWYERKIACQLPPGPKSDFTNDAVSIHYKTSYATDVTSEADVPIEYTRVVQSVDKKQALTDLKSGKEIPGIRLVQNYSLQVKPATLSVKYNAKQRLRNQEKRVIEHLPFEEDILPETFEKV